MTSVMPGRPALFTAGQNVLSPHSPAAHDIAVLWWVMFGVACVGLTLIAVLLLLGWVRRNRASLPFGGSERTATRLVVGLGIATPIVLLSALFVWSDLLVIRSTAAPGRGSTALTVHVQGHQWWWRIRYGTSAWSTANELHIPVRTRVNVVGTTADVIHSIWVPELNRKADVIPGRTTSLLLYADRPGTYLGQCAEFCGLQHAHMELIVVAESRAAFQEWLRAEAKPAANTSAAGIQLFEARGCADCHMIRGTPAGSHVGPDLTHVASRGTLAAGTIRDDLADLRRWVHNPQSIKPGAKMPEVPQTQAETDVLARYLESLK
jgi:cytochrome c oxidase subunit II